MKVFTEEKITILVSNMEKSSLSIFIFRAMKELKVTVIYVRNKEKILSHYGEIWINID